MTLIRLFFEERENLMATVTKNSFIVPLGCAAVEAVKTTVEGCSKNKICFLLEELKKKSKNNNVELSFLNGRKYHIKCNGKGGIIDIPQEISTIALLLMMEYLNRSPIICSTCKLCLQEGQCPKMLFV